MILTRAQVREVDRRAIEEFGIPGIVLMENAGRNAAALIAEWSKPGDRIAIVCGSGNNGGDGFVIARHLSNAGFAVACYLACDPGRLRGDALINHQIVERMRLPLVSIPDDAGIEELQKQLQLTAVIVDALLGTGFIGAPRPPVSSAIQAVNASSRRVIAIDVPSGMDCDTGVAAWSCVKAWRTITFVGKKKGFVAPGADSITGEVFVADIGAPRPLIQEIAEASG